MIIQFVIYREVQISPFVVGQSDKQVVIIMKMHDVHFNTGENVQVPCINKLGDVKQTEFGTF